MASKGLKNLSRRELIDIIYQMKKNEQEMQEEITALQSALQEKHIQVSEAGSIAEVAASITNILSAAQATADLYLQEISRMKTETEIEQRNLLDITFGLKENILAENEKQCEILRARYEADYAKWKQLRKEIKKLEEIRRCSSTGGADHE